MWANGGGGIVVEASRVFHLALTYASTTTTMTRFVAKSTARLRWACGGGKLLGRLTDTHRRRDGARRVAVPVFERARPLWQEEEGGRRGGEDWMERERDENGGDRESGAVHVRSKLQPPSCT